MRARSPTGRVRGVHSYDTGLIAHNYARATSLPRSATQPQTRWEDHTCSRHTLSPHFCTSYYIGGSLSLVYHQSQP